MSGTGEEDGADGGSTWLITSSCMDWLSLQLENMSSWDMFVSDIVVTLSQISEIQYQLMKAYKFYIRR